MTKQEEIRKLFTKYTGRTGPHLDYMLEEFDHAGVVIKVERELPSKTLSEDALNAIEVKGIFPHVAHAITLALAHQSQHIQQDMLGAGYVAVEPLIKE